MKHVFELQSRRRVSVHSSSRSRPFLPYAETVQRRAPTRPDEGACHPPQHPVNGDEQSAGCRVSPTPPTPVSASHTRWHGTVGLSVVDGWGLAPRTTLKTPGRDGKT